MFQTKTIDSSAALPQNYIFFLDSSCFVTWVLAAFLLAPLPRALWLCVSPHLKITFLVFMLQSTYRDMTLLFLGSSATLAFLHMCRGLFISPENWDKEGIHSFIITVPRRRILFCLWKNKRMCKKMIWISGATTKNIIWAQLFLSCFQPPFFFPHVNLSTVLNLLNTHTLTQTKVSFLLWQGESWKHYYCYYYTWWLDKSSLCAFPL